MQLSCVCVCWIHTICSTQVSHYSCYTLMFKHTPGLPCFRLRVMLNSFSSHRACVCVSGTCHSIRLSTLCNNTRHYLGPVVTMVTKWMELRFTSKLLAYSVSVVMFDTVQYVPATTINTYMYFRSNKLFILNVAD